MRNIILLYNNSQEKRAERSLKSLWIITSGWWGVISNWNDNGCKKWGQWKVNECEDGIKWVPHVCLVNVCLKCKCVPCKCVLEGFRWLYSAYKIACKIGVFFAFQNLRDPPNPIVPICPRFYPMCFPLKSNSVNLLSSSALKNSLEDNYMGLQPQSWFHWTPWKWILNTFKRAKYGFMFVF